MIKPRLCRRAGGDQPGGNKNQIEGGIVQAASWTLYERVLFDRSRILSRDWSSYPIMRFSQTRDAVEVHVLDWPGQPFFGTGEAAQGPTAAAIANAIADAVGVRMRHSDHTRTGEGRDRDMMAGVQRSRRAARRSRSAFNLMNPSASRWS
jgi:hypothetical protein